MTTRAGGRRAQLVVRAYVPIAVTAVLLALLPLHYGDSRTMMGVITSGLLFAAYAVGFNVILGSTGQLFLCVGALSGLGGYTSALLSDRAGLPFFLSIAVAGVGAAAIGGALSWIAVSRRLDVIFTGIVTLAFSLSFHNLLLGRRDLSGGETGLVVDAGSDTFFRERVAAYYLFLALVVAFLVVFRLLQRSHVGWAFRALRDDQIGAELAGVDVKRYRVYAGTIGAAMLGVAGGLYAHTEGFIAPSTFAFGQVDVRVLVMVAFGGLGTLLGPIIGAAAFTILDEWLVSFNEYRLIVYGVALLVLFLGFRRGVTHAAGQLMARLRRPASGHPRGSAIDRAEAQPREL